MAIKTFIQQAELLLLIGLMGSFIFSQQLHAQQEPLFTQYQTNMFAINPAAAGSSELQEIRLFFRAQWGNFPGSPKTLVMSYNGLVDNQNAIGFTAFHDALGPNVRNGLSLAYAFHLPLNRESLFLSFGLSGKLIQYRFRDQRIYFQNPNDPALAATAEGLLAGDVAFGTYLYDDKFFMGFSAPNLLQSNLDFSIDGFQRSQISKLYRHYFAVMGYRFDYEKISVEPSVMMRKVQSTPYQIEGNIKVYFMEGQLFVGGSYRTDWLLSLMFGFNSKLLNFSYSADFMGRVIEDPISFGTSHEFTVGWDLGTRRYR